ncbi:MAG TPA: hypothetical protein PLR99_19635 [Polyangiaceae bacterium]|nr:hypothetical protein [Polyangiaceae bacterium]
MLARAPLALALASVALFAAPDVLAASGPDLAVSLSAPPGVHVDETGRYTLTVTNSGNRSASNVTVSVALPRTHTSPQVYVLGQMGALGSGCSVSGTTLTCALGSIGRGRATSKTFDIALPYSTAPLVFDATVSTSSGDTNPANDTASLTAAPLTVPVAVAGPVTVTNRHCTGQALTSFYECELFPSSLSSHQATFNADGSISVPGEPTISGSWSQPSSDRLVFQYVESGNVVATFDGRGVRAKCFEGATTFGGPYVSMYEVCLP